jgi:hypothetical protein
VILTFERYNEDGRRRAHTGTDHTDGKRHSHNDPGVVKPSSDKSEA